MKMSVTVSFPYPGINPVTIPEKNLLGIFSPEDRPVRNSQGTLIRKAFAEPIGAVPLAQMAKGKKKILVVVDDLTRMTPVEAILPCLLDELGAGRKNSPEIFFMIALGTHQPMNEEEIARKVGREVASRYPVLNHAWWDPAQLDYLGETDSGIPIYVNRLAREADLIIGIGHIVPHRVTGFSGGGNIIQPGICGELTTGKTHWLAAQFTGREILGKIENPVKKEIEKIAHQAGLVWIANCILDGSGKLVDVVAGDPQRAYRAGAAKSYTIFRSLLPREADIVLVDSYPYDQELWLASKGIYAAELAVRQGGVVILVSPCPAGVSSSHPEVLAKGYHSYATVEEWVSRGEITKLTVAAHLVHVGRVIKERAQGILVSPGISKGETDQLGMIYGASPQEALDTALALLGDEAKVAVLKRGGEILPVINGESNKYGMKG
jgi:nickel-dependent lactate racemase